MVQITWNAVTFSPCFMNATQKSFKYTLNRVILKGLTANAADPNLSLSKHLKNSTAWTMTYLNGLASCWGLGEPWGPPRKVAPKPAT